MNHSRLMLLLQFLERHHLPLLFPIELTMGASCKDLYAKEKNADLKLQMNQIFTELNVIEDDIKEINLTLRNYDDEVKKTGNFERVRLAWEALQWDKWNNDQLKNKKLEEALAISAELDELNLESET